MSNAEAVQIIRVLLTRDADCRDGNLDITEREKEAIRRAVDALENMHEYCENSGCFMIEHIGRE